MKRRIQTSLWTLALLLTASLALPSTAHAAFLLIQEVSAESTAQAGAQTAAAGRPSTQYHNASNLSFIPGLHFEAAFGVYTADTSFTDTQGNTTEVELQPEFAPHFYASAKVLDWLAIGFAAFPNYGISLKWPDQWEGEHLVVRNFVESFTLNPNLSFGPFAGFAIAVGFDATWSAITLSRVLTLGAAPIGEEDVSNRMEMKGDGWGFGGNAGLSYQPTDWVRLGLGYRSTFDLTFDGTMDFDVTSPWAWRFPDQDFSLRIATPHQVNFGARFWPIPNLSVELDAWYFSWSLYTTRSVDLSDKGLYLGPDKIRYDDTTPQDLRDGFQIGLGMEYAFIEHFVMRAGIAFDSNVEPDKAVDPLQPDGHRIKFAAGFGTEWYGFYADVAYSFGYIIPHDVDNGAPLHGHYDTFKHVAVLSIGYTFDPFQ